MNKLKVAVYAITKNEEQFIDSWMDSMSEADLIVVADTGSTDRTVEKLRARGARVYSIKVDPWRFDIPRNISLNFVPANVDVCVCTDLDEVFEPGWREKIERIWTPDATRLTYMYTYKFNQDGSRGPTFWRGKIHRRHGFRWVHPVHEVLHFYGDEPDISVSDPTIQLNHFPDTTKSRGQYLPLLELSVRENPDYLVNLFYLGREYMYYKMWDKCIDTLQSYLNKSTGSWKDQRSAAMRFISRSYKEKKEEQTAMNWLYKAIAEAPHLREPFVDMAQLAYEKKDWPKVYHMVEEALKINHKPSTYLTEPSSWNDKVFDLGALSCYNLGLYEQAYEYAKVAVEMNPTNTRLQNNLIIIEKKWTSIGKDQ